MYESAVMNYLLSDDLMREFYITSRNKRVEFVVSKFKEMFKGKKTYEPVAGWVVDYAINEDAAERAFDLSNNPARKEERDRFWGNHRSLSVGDIVEVCNKDYGQRYFMCDSLGWVDITKELTYVEEV